MRPPEHHPDSRRDPLQSNKTLAAMASLIKPTDFGRNRFGRRRIGQK